ncbi:hypothetical protein [Telmatospirillum sp. J64-1]|uniref:hypothetical protein n=1 Tax=Telmatospirillum sp. J64-1 TaxID=2502183 RepID=UPI00115DB742|nr:hypothetical protein [Telmatospirillum sp. J64-1]
MSEPISLKERMEKFGWVIAADYDQDGVNLLPYAMKLRMIDGHTARAIAYQTDAEYEADLAACRKEWDAEWDAYHQSSPLQTGE